nr:integrase, catalytic region, zinc finger, CCHC-type, peptidase aspartic, catalytic [Tanacetum cinerariifolium]
MDESIPLYKQCQSFLEIFKVKTYVNTIITGMELCKQKIAKRTYIGYIDPFIQSTIESNFSPVISRINVGLEQFYREYYYADHMNAILGVYTELDEVTNLQCDYLELLENDLKAQLQDKGIVISELKKLIEKMKGKSVDTKFEKSSFIRQSNTFKSQRPSVLGKPTTFSNSFVRKDFSKSMSVTQNNVSNDFSKPVIAQTLPLNKNSIFKNMNVLASRILNAKNLNVNSMCATCDKCVLHDKHDMCVLTSVAKPIKKTVASEYNQKPRNFTTKLYERVSKTCSWWYSKFTPSGYKWKPKSGKENVNPNLSMPLGNASRSANVMDTMTSRRSTVSNTLLSSNSFAAHRDCPIHCRLWCSKHMTGNLKLLINFVEKFLGTVKFGNDQITPILGYGDLVQGAVTIKRVYYVEGLNHNLFSVGQFCDADLEVAFNKSTCYIRDLKGNDLLTGYMWKPKSTKENVNPNVSMPLANASRTNVKDTMTSRRSIVSKTPLSSNPFAAYRDCSIHRRLWVLKAQR